MNQANVHSVCVCVCIHVHTHLTSLSPPLSYLMALQYQVIPYVLSILIYLILVVEINRLNEDGILKMQKY